MKGIILAGGSGTRLHPLTISISKQLLAVYDKPMIYYPLSVLMLAEIKDILIISTPRDLTSFKNLFGDGSQLGIKISYEVQDSPDGLAQAFIIGEEFIGDDDVCLILGDNIFYGSEFKNLLDEAIADVKVNQNAIIFGNIVTDPQRYGIVEIDEDQNVLSVEEKPQIPKSNYAIVGLYFYPNSVINIAKNVKPSERGELEITSINEEYLNINKLKLKILSRGFAWLDTGTHETLSEATEFVKTVEKRTGLKIACLEEIAYNFGWIKKHSILKLIRDSKAEYYNYLNRII
jgi:glucose-1-phosphate thymidylyltransferase